MNNIKQSHVWQQLEQHQQEWAQLTLSDLFAHDPQRFDHYHLNDAGLILDFSKNLISEETIKLLLKLADDAHLESQIAALFSGQPLNLSENRPVLHTALRTPADNVLHVHDKDVIGPITSARQKINDFCQQIQQQRWLGFSNKAITDIVNLGIGGSYLGPAMVCQALQTYNLNKVNCHFVANIDSRDLLAKLERLNPETTLFIVSSKSFSTLETLTNAKTAKEWVLKAAPDISAFYKHFIAVTANEHKALEFGFEPQQIFPLWDWVGGRYSLWSSVGLPIALSIGTDNFQALLDGAHAMDKHFQETAFAENMPVILALLGIWYINFFNSHAQCIAPYSQDLKLLPQHLQQLEMESNGKSIRLAGSKVTYQTGPVIFGDVGALGQHAFHQLLHQGTQLIPTDFILPLKVKNTLAEHQTQLAACCFSQSQALMLGKSETTAYEELLSSGMQIDAAKKLAPHKILPGNRPSNTILLESLSPYELGALIALYEHKTFVQGAIWQINSFDQWGVELGKQLAKAISTDLTYSEKTLNYDSSTNALITYYRKMHA